MSPRPRGLERRGFRVLAPLALGARRAGRLPSPEGDARTLARGEGVGGIGCMRRSERARRAGRPVLGHVEELSRPAPVEACVGAASPAQGWGRWSARNPTCHALAWPMNGYAMD